MKHDIDIETWERKENYNFFRNFVNPTISITSEVACDFTSMTATQEFRHGSNYPLMNAGKAVTRGGELVMPIAMTVHHGFMDGHHFSLFFKKVEEFLK